MEDALRLKMRILNEIIQFSINFPDITNIEYILEYILKETIKLFNAEGGTIYIKEGSELIFKIAKNIILEEKFKDKWLDDIKNIKIPISPNSIAGYSALTSQILWIDVNEIDPSLPFKFNPEIDKKYGYKTVNTIVIPLKDRKGIIIGVIQLINVKNHDGTFKKYNVEDLSLLDTISTIIAINIENSMLHERLMKSYIESLYRLGTIAEFRDNETFNHIRRVGEYSKIIGENFGLDKRELEYLYITAPMHDIGKVGISDTILLKPGRLTDEERAVMQLHTIIGAEIFARGNNELDFYAQIVALTHHERWDGKGYPIGLKEKDIPIQGRIVAIADVFDALMSKRVYKNAWSLDETITYFKENKGTQFDPYLVDIFIKKLNDILEVFYQLKDQDSSKNNNDELTDFEVKNLSLTFKVKVYNMESIKNIIKINPLIDRDIIEKYFNQENY